MKKIVAIVALVCIMCAMMAGCAEMREVTGQVVNAYKQNGRCYVTVAYGSVTTTFNDNGLYNQVMNYGAVNVRCGFYDGPNGGYLVLLGR